MSLSATAYAKINLCLHVTGKRADGYHLLDSIVAFADMGDRLTARKDASGGLRISGPFGEGLSVDSDNLVLRAAELAGARGYAIHLEKNLPVAAGIGGGSADAAACLRMFGAAPDPATVLALGADVPVCVASQTVRMRGIGEDLTPLPELPPIWVVLVNAGQPVPTGAVFNALALRDNSPLAELPEVFEDATAVFRYLAAQRNDLEAPARSLFPMIDVVLQEIAVTKDCGLARMSGSGGTCFGLYATKSAAESAAGEISAKHPDWWVTSAALRR
ncbi:MAG TPA: 4-(cytidine 5'-diphospho)-2-C-methyl-D-erythritol kinase [Paracoccaceae bacterium]|nr:4-(cytidine 5'-diphospho)-2-C-methyl-D-erythritol kinase [Paracoccaceae bacterium]